MTTVSDEEMHEIEYDDIEMETEGSILFTFDLEQVWLPRYAIEVDREQHIVLIPRSIIEEKGLDNYV